MNTDTNSTVHAADLNRATAQAVADGQTATASADYNTFRPYNAQLGAPSLEGYRNVKCLYKVNAKTHTSAGENSYIRIIDSITEEAVAARITELAPYLVGYLQEQENILVKKLHVAGMTVLSPQQYGIDAVVAHLEESGVSNRLNKEKIEDWFTGAMLEPLMVAFGDKMQISSEPTDAELEKLDTIISVYKAKFGSLASGKTAYRVEEADMLLRSLEITGADKTIIGTKFVARLEKMKVATPDDLLLAL